MQTMIGTAAHLSTESLVASDEHVARLLQTIEEFENTNVVMPDPRKDCVEVFTYIKGGVKTLINIMNFHIVH